MDETAEDDSGEEDEEEEEESEEEDYAAKKNGKAKVHLFLWNYILILSTM